LGAGSLEDVHSVDLPLLCGLDHPNFEPDDVRARIGERGVRDGCSDYAKHRGFILGDVLDEQGLDLPRAGSLSLFDSSYSLFAKECLRFLLEVAYCERLDLGGVNIDRVCREVGQRKDEFLSSSLNLSALSVFRLSFLPSKTEDDRGGSRYYEERPGDYESPWKAFDPGKQWRGAPYFLISDWGTSTALPSVEGPTPGPYRELQPSPG